MARPRRAPNSALLLLVGLRLGVLMASAARALCLCPTDEWGDVGVGGSAELAPPAAPVGVGEETEEAPTPMPHAPEWSRVFVRGTGWVHVRACRNRPRPGRHRWLRALMRQAVSRAGPPVGGLDTGLVACPLALLWVGLLTRRLAVRCAFESA